MFKKKNKFNPLFLTGILIYSAFIGILYLRMKYADKMLRDYSNAQTCIVASNCRETLYVEVLDYGSSKMSFANYGPKGMPMGTTTFEDYIFVVLGDGLKKTTLKVLPGLSFDLEKFDIANVYLPSKSDSKITNKDFLIGKKVSVEIWRNVVTYILINSSNTDSVENPTNDPVFIGPLKNFENELALPTENHPVIRLALAKRDFEGWSVGIVFMLVSSGIFGISVMGLFLGIDWIIKRIIKSWRKDE